MQSFYAIRIEGGMAYLDAEESLHLTQVLRRQVGAAITLSDGSGQWYDAELSAVDKRGAMARIIRQWADPLPENKLHVGIAPTKNMDRLEWFLEKAVEIGIGSVTPLLCQRSERQQLRLDRLEKIARAAMKQSLRARLPLLHPLTPFRTAIESATEPIRCIAWCPNTPPPDLSAFLRAGVPAFVLVGPEGDFSDAEVALAQQRGFVPVGLGPARLRTETAALMVVARYALQG